jgi:branched-chain amino acid transport system ATP-binding protein
MAESTSESTSEFTEASTLVVANVSVEINGTKILDDISLTARPGDVLGIIGPNGAGKTSLLNVITGALVTTAGSVTYAGVRLDTQRPHRVAALGVGRSFQSTQYFMDMTALDLVSLAFVENRLIPRRRSARAGGGNADRQQQAYEALDRLGAAEFADRRLGDLPLGVQKRVDFARAVVGGSRLLLLDEPTSGLSSEERENLGPVIRGLQSPDRIILLIDHDPAFVAQECSRLMAMNFGQVLAEGSPREVLTGAAVAEAYLGKDAAAIVQQIYEPP